MVLTACLGRGTYCLPWAWYLLPTLGVVLTAYLGRGAPHHLSLVRRERRAQRRRATWLGVGVGVGVGVGTMLLLGRLSRLEHLSE